MVIGPGGDASLNMPLEAEATFVAVVGLFRHPDTQRNTRKQVLAREELIRTSRAFSPPNTTSYGSGLKRRSNVKQTFAAGPSRQFALNLRNQRTGDNHLHPAQPVSSQHREIT
nr:Type VI secretion lipoprotein [Klebsiella pneumoniae]